MKINFHLNLTQVNMSQAAKNKFPKKKKKKKEKKKRRQFY